MATPNKYSTPLQYPSQSADYISLESGGSYNNSNRNDFKIHNQKYFKDRSFGSPQYNNYNHNYRRNYNNYSNNQNDFRENKRKHFNNSQKNSYSNSEYDFSLYFHPSMLQDPWENLMKRYESLCSSKINIKEPSSE